MSTAGVQANPIRRVLEDDLPQLRSHMGRLGRNGLRARFGYQVSDRFLDAYAERCVSVNAIVYGYFEAGTMHGVGEMHLAACGAERRNLCGELAFSIEPDWRRCGIGTRLIERLLLTAHDRHVECLTLQCAADNWAMLSLARKHATDLTFEQGIVTGRVPIGRPGPYPRFCEAAPSKSLHTPPMVDKQALGGLAPPHADGIAAIV